MKRFRIIAVLALAICLIAGTMSVFAYGHKVTVSAGNGAALVAAIAAAAIAIARRRSSKKSLISLPHYCVTDSPQTTTSSASKQISF